MNNYNYYKITSGNHVYVGKTRKEITTRFIQHVNNYTLYKKNPLGCVNFTSSFLLFDRFGIENCTVSSIMTILCHRKEASILEGLLIVNYKNNRAYVCNNKNIAGRSQQEYRLANIGKINEKHGCCCGGKFTYNGKSQHVKTLKHVDYLAGQLIQLA